MRKETSQQNIQKAQDSRRLIGVNRFLEKLQEYKLRADLWKQVRQQFKNHGFKLETRNESLEFVSQRSAND